LLPRIALIEALTGRFDEHHGELATVLLVPDRRPQRTDRTSRSAHRRTDCRHAHRSGATGRARPRRRRRTAYLAAVDRLDEITGVGRRAAQVIIAAVGLNMAIFPTLAHLVSWAKIDLTPRQPIRGQDAIEQDRQGQTPTSRACSVRPPHQPGAQHIPRRPIPPPGQTHRQAQSPHRNRPLHPRHRLAPTHRPHQPLPRSWPTVLRRPDPSRTQQDQPHPPTRSTRLHRQAHPRSLTTSLVDSSFSDQVLWMSLKKDLIDKRSRCPDRRARTRSAGWPSGAAPRQTPGSPGRRRRPRQQGRLAG
jgi:transposase